MTVPAPPDIVRIVPAGDSALLVEFPQRIDPLVNGRAIALGEELERRCGAAVRDAVTGYASLTLYFDPLHVDAAWLESEIRDAAAALEPGAAPPAAVVEVPVCYGGALGPDLADVAGFGGCAEADVIDLHAAGTYRVYLLGFIPGFAYMAEVDPRIAAPRRATPRAAVPAGSVAIAGPQTGIYPATTPGGWNIIGRTPLRPYDAARRDPFLFRAGDTVRFRPMTLGEFQRAA